VFGIDGMALSVITLLTAKKHIAHELCHVIRVSGVKRNHTVGIPVPDLAIQYTTFYGATMMTSL